MIFITIDITRAIGLEKKYKDLKIVCLYESDVIPLLRKSGVPILCLHELGRNIQPMSASILTDKEVVKWIQTQEKDPRVLVFKPTAKLEAICKHYGWKLMNPESRLNRLYEDKISFYEIGKEIGLNMPKTFIRTLGELTWDDSRQFGEKIVLQLRRGHAGETSFIVENENDLSGLKKELSQNHQVKVSEFLRGETWTWNGSIDKNGKVSLGIPMKQITGVADLNKSRLGTCGVVADASFPVPEKLINDVQKLGKHMFDRGYVGIFGIDVIITPENAYIIECNARFTATISFHTQLESLKTVHQASQIILRNTEDVPMKIRHHLKSGIYSEKNGTITFKNEDIHLEKLHPDHEFLLLVRPSGSVINPGLEIGYVQALHSLVTHEISPVIVHTLANIEKIKLESYIDPKNFLDNTFGSVKGVADILKKPLENHQKLTPRAITRNRQTQCAPDDPSFRILGERNGYYLIEKYDGTKGWLWKDEAEEGKGGQKDDNLTSPDDFLKQWKGVPYLWGGVTKKGIDCSGFVQRYFLETKRRVLPKHSQDQRKMGKKVNAEKLKNGDILFLKRNNTYHTAVFHENRAWHACLREKKVIAEPLETLLSKYSLEECRRISA